MATVEVNTGSHGKLCLVATEVSTDAVANTSEVSWALYLVEKTSSPNASFNLGDIGAWVKIGATTVWSGDFSFDWRSSGQQTTLIASGTNTVAHNANGTGTAAVEGHIDSTGTSGAGGPTNIDNDLSLTTLYLTPDAPSSVSATRVSDTQHTVAWTRNPDTRKPYTTQKLQRWDNVTGVWATIAAALAGSAESFTDTTTVANRRYQYRVAAVNSGGTSAYGESNFVQTTPAQPSNVQAVKSGADVVLTWDDGHSAGMAVTLEIEHAADDVWDGSPLDTVAGGVETYTHVEPSPAETHTYRVRTKSAVPDTLYSSNVESNTVQLATVPNAPTALAPNGSAVDATEGQLLSWTHSSADSSEQTQFQIRHRATGAGSWTTETAVTSATSEWTLPADTYSNGSSFEWEVRTWGVHATESPWSATASVTTSTRPTASIAQPSGTATISTLTLEWAYYDAESTAQTKWEAELYDGDDVLLESKNAATAATSTTFATPVEDGQDYTVKVRVRDASNVWSAWDEYAFSVSYLPPADVALAASYDRASGSMVITLVPDDAEEAVTVESTSVDVQRRIDGGPWVTFASGLDPDATFLDVLPTINGTNEYRAIVYSALPSSKTMPAVEVVTDEQRWFFVNAGDAFATAVKFFGRGRQAGSSGRRKQVHTFADGTRREYSGPVAGKQWAVSGMLTADASPLADFIALSQVRTIGCVRTPLGVREFVSLGDVSHNAADDVLIDISWPMESVDHVA